MTVFGLSSSGVGFHSFEIVQRLSNLNAEFGGIR